MKKQVFISALILITALFMPGCSDDDENFENPAVNFKAQAKNGLSKTIDMENGVYVDEYRVKFYKVEIGNSEDDKFTLWEDADGSVKNIAAAGPINFRGENEPEFGTYKFCRVTIHNTIELEGFYQPDVEDDPVEGEASVTVTGNFATDGEKEVFLFGTADQGVAGNFVLTDEIDVEDGSELTFIVNIAGTVDYSSITGVTLSEPSMTFTSDVE